MDMRHVCGDGNGATIEPLEPRLLLAADVVISEIMYQSLTEAGAPEDYGQEYVELFNRGDSSADLLGWKITAGVDFEFPAATIGAGEYLVVTADPTTFAAEHPGAGNYIADYGWDGHLSNSGEKIELVDDLGVTIDQVTYADEGDWADRQWVEDPDYPATSGYNWSNLHDGGGRSLAVINPAMTNNSGLNWTASLVDGGTPGAVNGVDTDDIAPLIRNVEHYPIIPTASDKVTVTAKVQDELATGLVVSLRYRYDGDPDFDTAVMYDDGLHDDGAPGDGIYAGQIDERGDGAIVEFYVEATDAGANTRTWPAPVATRGQVANCQYQVDDSFTEDWTPGSQPIYRAILTAEEWSELDSIEDNYRNSNAQRNVTLVTTDGVNTQVRYEVGMRNRGNGSRSNNPHNQKINIPHDRSWEGLKAFVINAQRPHAQAIGSAIFRYADIPAADATPIEFLINGTNFASGGMYYSYAFLEALDTDMAANHWPGDSAGELYKCHDSNAGGDAADMDYVGPDPDDYRLDYVKQTNVALNDYSGLINMLGVLNNAPDETYLADVAEVIDIEQWMRFLAVDTLLANGEGGLTSGRGDDYAMYQGVIDPRFTLVPYDLDTILGLNNQSFITDTIWDYRRTSLNGLSRLLNQPEVVQIYYAQLLELCDTVFSPEIFDPLIDQVLGGWVSANRIDAMKQFAVDRVANVRGQVANDPLSAQATLPVVNGYPKSTSGEAALTGTASGAYVQSVMVNGEPADWDLETGTWTLGTGGTISGGQVVFQNGVNGYSGTVDTEIRFSNPTGNLSGNGSINVDGADGGGRVQALIRFDDIFGSGAGQVAWDATILDATLTLNVTNPASGTTSMHRMVMPWLETANWNTFTDGVNADGVEAAFAVDATPDLNNTGDRSVNVKQAILDWQSDPVGNPNYGWALLSTNTNGTDFGSSENPSTGNRPELIITIEDGGSDPGEGGASLLPGLNRLVVQAFDGPDGTGEILDETYVDVWYESGAVPPREISGTLTADTVLDAAGPWTVTGSVTVPDGMTLTIEPDAVVTFNSSTMVTVNGRLLAEGTPGHRITLTGAGATWNGIVFDYPGYSDQVNRLTYADISYSEGGDEAILITNGQLEMDNVEFTNHAIQFLDIADSSIIVRNCTFPDASGELVHYWGFPATGYAIFDGNYFGRTSGYNDIIDLTGGQRPGPIAQFTNNYFAGGGDDGIDVDAADAHIEGNIFVDFHQSESRESKSHPISTGTEYGETSNVTIVRNLFYDNDHAILIKDGAFGTIVNNTIVNVYKKFAGTDATTGAINLYEPRAGQWEADGVYLDGNIFQDVSQLFEHPDPATLPVGITMNNSIVYPATVGEPVSWVGTGNQIGVDPLLTETVNVTDPVTDFILQAGSPAFGAGPNGVDVGGLISAGATIDGEPPAVTNETTATLTVGGPEIYGYKYRLNGGAWSAERAPVKTVGSIILAGSTATVTITGHGWSNGDVIDIFGSKQQEYNGTFTISNVAPDTFDFTVTGAPASPATGKIIARRPETIELTGLTTGVYTVEVIAKNSAGTWQGESQATASKTWAVGLNTNLTVRDSYLPGTPVLVQVEVLAGGELYRDLWDATAILSTDNGVQMDVSEITMYNGLGSALVTFTGGTGDFTLTASVDGLGDTDDLTDLSGAPVTEVSGTLSEASGTDTWSGVIHVTGDVLVPTGHTLNVTAGTLVLLDGDPTPRSSAGVDIDVEGTINSLGTADQPVSFTAFVSGAPWGEFHHSNAQPSLYQYTHISQAGHSPGGGHTGHGPVFRPSNSVITFEHASITDNRGKVMQSGGGSDITFRDSVMARSVSGPEIDNTALLMEDTYIIDMRGMYREDGVNDDDDGIYIHGQGAGQDVTLRGGVIAGTDDDGLDTLGATVVVEDYIFRDIFDKGTSVYGGSVTFNGIISADNGIGISAKDGSHAEVHIDHATITGNTWGIQAENKGGGMGGALIEYFITNSIIYGNTQWEVRSDYDLAPISIDYSIVGPNWISDGGYRGVPDEVHTGEVWPGTNNANADPLFVAPGTGDFHLRSGSPAINAGSDLKDMGYYADATVAPAPPAEGDGPAQAPVPVSGSLTGDTTWATGGGPYTVSGNFIIPAAYTLTIEPGVTVFFQTGAQMTVNGRLVAEGTEFRQVRFAGVPGGGSWNGLQFADTMLDNRISYAILSGSTRTGGMVDLDDSNLTIDHATFEGADRRRIASADSSLIVRNSTFADFDFGGSPPNNVAEHIWGGYLPAGGHFILENNVFGLTEGHNDAVDFNAGSRPDDPIPQILNNTFLGGGDDALDLEGDFHVEGNVFMNYRKDAAHQAVDGGECNVISAGSGHEYIVVGNFFYDSDHVTLIKEGSFMTFTNNTVVNVNQGPYANIPGAINFNLIGETGGPGEGAYVDGSIFTGTPLVFGNLDTEGSTTDLIVNRSILPAAEHGYGVGNMDADPRLVDPAGGDFSLRRGSPAIGVGPVGVDMGADVPAGAAVSDAPLTETYLADATFDVSGDADPRHAGFLAYKYRLNGGAWSAEQTPGTQIALSGLGEGAQLLEVISQNFAGAWQEDADAIQRSWNVNTSLSRVLVNEVLATNRTAHEHDLRSPDVIELYNDSPATIADLEGWSITDNPAIPTKYVFTAGTTIAPESYLVLYAETPGLGATGIYLGFDLDGDGQGVYLYDDIGTLVDSVDYGLQIADLSIGRTGPAREWALTQPTTGAPNVAQPVVDPDAVLINEWFANGDVVLVEDFVELYNPGTLPADLAGLYVTDNPANQKTKHQIAPLSFIGAEGFVALKADSRTVPGHVDFRLRANMEILGLFDTNVAQLDRVYYGPQTEDVSQGRTADGSDNIEFFTLPTPDVGNVTSGITQVTNETLLAEGDGKYVLLPDINTVATWPDVDFATWPVDGFDTTGWTYWDGSPAGVGFDSGDGAYLPLIGANVIAMDNVNSSCYIAYPFTFAGDPADFTSLSLNVRYDDGFIAYLNGQEIYRELFALGDIPAWDSSATDIHDDDEALILTNFDVTDFKGELNTGANLLAIHGLNENPSSSDFLMSAELVGVTETTLPNPFENLLAVHNDLRITEIMYNPAGSDDKEFIEFQNTGTADMELEGVRLTDGVDFVFPAMTLGAGEYVVVARDEIEFHDFYNDPTINVAGSYAPNSLSNAGEDILLQMPGPYEAAILRFNYNDNWYPATDGDGASLVLRNPLGRRASWDDRESWYPSAIAGGSPGIVDPLPEWPLGSVVVNELLAHTDGGVEDWIELHNTTASDIDISGWFLSDNPGNLTKFVIPGDPSNPGGLGNTILPAGGYLAFNQVNDFGGAFALSELGDDVIVSSCDINGDLSTYRGFVSFGATANGVALGRHVLSTGEVDFVAMDSPTYEGANSDPLVGPIVIEEIMYNPAGPGGNEYIMMRNISASPVPLYDPANPANTWQITGGTLFVFPQTNVTVQPGEFVLITNVAPATYLATHTVGANVQVFGPMLGPLSNGGDTTTLSRPGNPETDPVPLVPYITVEAIKYNDAYPWPGEPDGDGPALSKLTASLGEYGNDPINWGFSGGPVVTVEALTTEDPTPQLTGTVSDVHQPTMVTVTLDGNDYIVPVVGDTWTLADDTIAPPLAGGTYDVAVSAFDAAGNLGIDSTSGELVIDLPLDIAGRPHLLQQLRSGRRW